MLEKKAQGMLIIYRKGVWRHARYRNGGLRDAGCWLLSWGATKRISVFAGFCKYDCLGLGVISRGLEGIPHEFGRVQVTDLRCW